ncbi:hypothetical protein [Hymenobacter sp. YC55]|uniref:hypothetical protein n=1 Tax=Hymenobacter sp. YC55 TaxID=3034019 RepID=UPI0023F7A849|nr:hypothetical protein [Hymenobacter sp. YC55]MDF7810699.1 hypothetical protein [Hymenobacter sp. YC55]
MCDYLLSEDARHLAVIREVDKWMMELSRPDMFSDGDPDNVITQLHRSFENLCANLATNGTPNAGELPLFQFHARLSWLQKKLERESR